MPFDMKKLTKEEEFKVPGTELHERIPLEEGNVITGKVKELRTRLVEVEDKEKGTVSREVVSLLLEDLKTGDLGELTGWIDPEKKGGVFGRQLKTFFGHKTPMGYELKAEYLDAVVEIAKIPTVSESSGQTYHQMGVKVKSQPNAK